jgi:hypothetical protein
MGGRALRNVFLGPLAFGGAGVVFWLGLTALYLFPNPHRLPVREVQDNFYFAAYLAGLGTGLSALGFFAATTPWPSWRNQPTLRVVLLSAGLGLFASLFPIAGLTFFIPGLSMLVRKARLLSVAITFSSPGVLCGLLGFCISKILAGGLPGEKRP